MNDEVIRLRNVTKYYTHPAGRTYILRGQSLSLRKGQHLGVLSASAAGKTTITRMLCGVEKPNMGRIERLGSVSWPLGFAAGFHPHLTAEENLRIIAGLYSFDADELVAFCQLFSELGDDFHKPVTTYSAGMRARLAFSLSMAMDFDAYVADEVVGVGDGEFRARCEAALKARIEGRAFIFFSRNQRALEAVCNSAAVLKDGRITMCESFNDAADLLGCEANDGS